MRISMLENLLNPHHFLATTSQTYWITDPSFLINIY